MKHFQTMYWNAKLMRHCRWCALLWQWLCGLKGHEPSPTDWGYGGGDYADSWCRWCNKMFVIPKSELQFRMDKNKRELLKLIK